MKIFKYKSYADYVVAQKKANQKKARNVWAVRENIQAIAHFLKGAENGLCHGVRQGHEVQWFIDALPGCDVIGTEIGDASAPGVIRWDFNNERQEWLGYFDFIYSNSFDHSYDPAETFKVWYRQIKRGGKIILEYDQRQEHTGEISMAVNKTDPVSITVDELPGLVASWVDDAEVNIIDLPVVKIGFQKAVIITKC